VAELLAKSAGKFYLISRINVESNPELREQLLIDYGSLTYEPSRGEAGDVDRDYDLESDQLDNELLLVAAEDYIEKRQIHSAQDYFEGDGFVYELSSALAEEMWLKDSEMESHPAVQRVINYAELRQKYPDKF
jgi:hypothetical protein